MATGTDLLTLAIRDLGVRNFDQSPDAFDQANGLIVLIDLLDQLADGFTKDGLYQQAVAADVVVGGNVRARVTASDSVTPTVVTLPADPCDGWRVQVVNAAANACTVARNGHKLSGAASNASVNAGAALDRFFRADLGDWISPTITALSDTIPYPASFDSGLAAMLTMMLAAKYGLQGEISQTVAGLAAATQTQLDRRYGARREG